MGSPETAVAASSPATRPCPPEALARLGSHVFVHDDRIRRVQFASDGTSLLAFSDHGARRWNLATGAYQPAQDAKHPDAGQAVSPNGLRAATSRAGETWIRDVDGSGHPVQMDGGGSFMPWLAFSPDGKWLAGSCDIREGNVTYCSTRIWDAATGHVLHNIPGSSEAGVFSPDGGRLAVSKIFQVLVFESATGREILRLPGEFQHIWGIDFSPDGKLLATGEDQMIRFWDAHTGREAMAGVGHSEPIQTVAFAPDGRTIFTGGLDGRIILWSWPEAGELRRIEKVGSSWGVQALTVSPDGLTVAATAWVNAGHPFSLFEVATGKRIAAFGKDVPAQGPILWAPGGKEVVTGIIQPGDGFAVWNAASGAMVRTSGQSPEGIVSLALAPGTKELWSVSRHGSVESRDWMSGTVTRSLQEHAGGGVTHLALSPDGRRLAAGSHAWDLDTGKLIRGGPDHNAPVSISPDGRLLASGDENAVVVWEFMTQREIHRFKLDTGQVKALAFSPDGTTLVSSDYADALVWDMTGRLDHGRLVDESLTRPLMESLWQSLARDDAWAAYRAAWRLAGGASASARFLSERLHPATSDPARVEALHQAFSNPDFDVRERAARELVDRGVKLQPADIEALRRPGPMVDARATRWDMEHPLASGLTRALLPPPVILPLPERLASSRAILALENNRSREAQSLLETLAGGDPSAPQTLEAGSSLARRHAGPPRTSP